MIVSPLLVKAIHSLPKKMALELGFGNGIELLYLISKEWYVTGIEKDSLLINEIKKLELEHLELIQEDILNYSFEKKFDLINCNYVLHFLKENARIILKKIQEATNPDGINLIITFLDKGEFEKFNEGFFKENELKELYSDWQILEYFEKEVNTKEIKSDGTQKKQFAGFLLAIKKNR